MATGGLQGGPLPDNINPYDKYPDRRDEEVTEFRARMKERGLKELAFTTYPPGGEESAGYSFAMLISTGDDIEETIRCVIDKMMEIHRMSCTQMK